MAVILDTLQSSLRSSTRVTSTLRIRARNYVGRSLRIFRLFPGSVSCCRPSASDELVDIGGGGIAVFSLKWLKITPDISRIVYWHGPSFRQLSAFKRSASTPNNVLDLSFRIRSPPDIVCGPMGAVLYAKVEECQVIPADR